MFIIEEGEHRECALLWEITPLNILYIGMSFVINILLILDFTFREK
jgi:hypothetical protein